MLTLTLNIDLLFENLTPNIKQWICKNTICTMPLRWGFHGRPVAWGQVSRLGVEKPMYVALS